MINSAKDSELGITWFQRHALFSSVLKGSMDLRAQTCVIWWLEAIFACLPCATLQFLILAYSIVKENSMLAL